MNDPPRLIDDSPSELESALIRAGRDYRAPTGTHAKTLAAMGVVGSTALLVKSSAAASFWSLKSIVIGGAIVGVVAAGAVLATSTPRPNPASSAGVPDGHGATVEATPAPVLPHQPSATEAPPEAEEPPAPAPTSPSALTRAASITAEVKAIDAARSALAAGNGAEALKLLDEHARRFPQGRLHLEAEVLRIEALARSGNRSAAKARAKAFVERHPNSVFTPRVKRVASE